MAIRSITLDDATDEQKRAFVTQFLNLELDDDATPDQIDSAIARAQPNATMIFIQDEPEGLADNQPLPDDELNTGRMAGSLGKGDPKWTINIPVVETEDGSGARDVVVGVNGRAWQMMRGYDITVPHRVVIALENAIQSSLTHQQTKDGEVDEITRKAKRFPYQIVERPSEAEIAAWDEKVGAEFCA